MESFYVTKSVLYVRVYNEFGESEYFAAEVECVTEARLFPFLGGECLDWFEVEVVVEVQIVEVLAVNEQVEHVVALAYYLQRGLDPVKLGHLEELGLGERLKEGAFALRLGGTMVQLVEHPDLKEFLVGDADLDGVALGTAFLEPL